MTVAGLPGYGWLREAMNWLGEGQPGELRGRAGARSRTWQCLGRGSRAGGGIQVFGCGEGCGSLGGVLLGFAEFGDGFGERSQPGDEHDRGQRPVASEVGVRGQQPGGLPEPVPGRAGRRDTPIR